MWDQFVATDFVMQDKLVGKLKKQFTTIKLDIAIPLIHVGLEIARASDGYYILMKRYERDLAAFTNL